MIRAVDRAAVAAHGQIAGRIYARVLTRFLVAAQRPTNDAIAVAVADVAHVIMVDGVLCRIDDLAALMANGRMPVRAPLTVVSMIAYGIAEGIREGELGHFRYQIEDRRLGRKKGPVRVYTDQYKYGFLNISRPDAVHGRSGLKSTPKLAGVD